MKTRPRYRKRFLDDTHIFSMAGLRRIAHPAEDHHDNPILVGEHPWEGHSIQLYGNSVLYDPAEKKFRMFYLAYRRVRRLSDSRVYRLSRNLPSERGATFNRLHAD